MKASTSGILSDHSRFPRGVFTLVSEGVAKVYRECTESNPYLLRVFAGIAPEIAAGLDSYEQQVIDMTRTIPVAADKDYLFYWNDSSIPSLKNRDCAP